MPETLIADLADYRELIVSVRNDSAIRVSKMVYSVPCRLIGKKLLAQIGENEIVLLAGTREVARLPLSRGDRGAVIDFRHLIGHLLRKQGRLRATGGARSCFHRWFTARLTIIWSAPAAIRTSGIWRSSNWRPTRA